MENHEQNRGNVWDRFWGRSRVVPTSNLQYRASTASRKIDFFLAQGIVFDPDCKVLECGCGDGEVALAIAQRFGVEVIGVDYSEQACEATNTNAQKLGVNVRAIRADARALPLASDSLDIIVSLGVIEHDREPIHQLRELARVVKPDGVLLLMTPNKWSFAKLDHLWREFKGTWPIGYQKEFSPNDLSRMCLQAGFSKTTEMVTLREPTASGNAPIDKVARYDKAISRLTRSATWGFYSWVFARKQKPLNALKPT